MKKFYAVVVAMLFAVGLLFSHSVSAVAEDAMPPAAPVEEVAAPVEEVADDVMAEEFDEAKILRDAAAKLKGIAGDADAQKLAGQLEELASDYEY